jgi:hypothetical protein
MAHHLVIDDNQPVLLRKIEEQQLVHAIRDVGEASPDAALGEQTGGDYRVFSAGDGFAQGR